MPMLSIRAVTQRQTDYKTFERSLVDNRTRCKKLFEPKKEEGSEK